jgi:hypothetical protein
VQKLPGEIRLGIATHGAAGLKIDKGFQAIVAQEVRSPFAGKFTLKVQLCGHSTDRKWFEDVFLKQFACKAVLFQYTDPTKKATARQEHVAVNFIPTWSDAVAPQWQVVEVAKEFINPTPGANFSFGRGLGVAVIVEKVADGPLDLPAKPLTAMLRVKQFDLAFTGKPRNEDVKV